MISFSTEQVPFEKAGQWGRQAHRPAQGASGIVPSPKSQLPRTASARPLTEGLGQPPRLGESRVKGEDNVASVGFYSGTLGQWILFQFNYEKSEKELDGRL